MGTQTPEQYGNQPPEQVIAWLRSPEGERWSRSRIGWDGRLHSHLGEGGFAEVIPDQYGKYARARWPRPYKGADLGDER